VTNYAYDQLPTMSAAPRKAAWRTIPGAEMVADSVDRGLRKLDWHIARAGENWRRMGDDLNSALGGYPRWSMEKFDQMMEVTHGIGMFGGLGSAEMGLAAGLESLPSWQIAGRSLGRGSLVYAKGYPRIAGFAQRIEAGAELSGLENLQLQYGRDMNVLVTQGDVMRPGLAKIVLPGGERVVIDNPTELLNALRELGLPRESQDLKWLAFYCNSGQGEGPAFWQQFVKESGNSSS
jgi:hypothetical protein